MRTTVGPGTVDWGELTPTLRPGDWTCATHGRIRPRIDTTVPACPDCGRGALRVGRHPHGGQVTFVEPQPSHCAGPDRHRLDPGGVHLNWRACRCEPAVAAGTGGHRVDVPSMRRRAGLAALRGVTVTGREWVWLRR